MKYIKLKSCVLLLMLSACGGSFDEHKTSMVISSGPYRQKYDMKSGLLYKMIVGGEKTYNGEMYYRTSAIFRKDDGSRESLIFSFLVGELHTPKDSSYYYYTEYASPGVYSLEKYQIGNSEVEYNSAKCGKISFTVYPDEALYIGGIKPDPKIIMDKGAKHYIPYFESDNKEMALKIISENIEIQKLKNPMLKKTLSVRMPKNIMTNPPSDCLAEAKPIWERF